MNPEQEPLIRQEEENMLNVGDVIRIVQLNWYWFVLSAITCVAVAYLYLQRTPKQYTRTATVLIKDETKGSGAMGESAAFSDLGMYSMKSSVDNEVLIFQSKQLMRNVTRRLKLDVSYTVKRGLRITELYTQSPVHVVFPDAEPNQVFALTVTPIDKDRVLLSGFEAESVETSDVKKVGLRDTVQTPIGRVVVTPTLFYTAEYFQEPILVQKRDQEGVAQQFSGALQVGLASKTSTIINLTLQDVSIPRAEDVINTLIAIYNEDAVNDKNLITVSTSDFITDRLIIIEKELGNVDSNIESFKRENQLTDIVSETGMYLRETSEYSKEGLNLENQRTLARYIREYLTDPSKEAELIPSNTGISDVNVESQISEYNTLLMKRDRLVDNSSNLNPVVMDLNKSILAMKQTIVRSVDNLIVSLDIQVRNVRSREEQTARRISAVPGQQKEVLSIERQQKIKEELYLYLLNKREENALSQAITESNARVIDPASGSKSPIAPKGMMVMMAALVVGCILPGGVLWIIVMVDTRVRERKDVEDKLSAPFLGEIPFRKLEKGEKINEMTVCENGRDAVSEAFRIVRTNMEFMRMGAEQLQVVMFTSLNVSAGKTFISSNLAMSLALAGKKVVLVDLDIRKGTLSSNIRATDIGVINYLAGKENSVDAIIQPSGYHPNLDVISNGPVPPNPAELLLSENLDRLIAELRKRYDYVILDNVPSNMIADAVIVNRVADLTIYVIRAGMMDRRQLPDIEKLYRQKKFKNMAILLNGVKYSTFRYGYNSYAAYGYGYGYGSDKKKKR